MGSIDDLRDAERELTQTIRELISEIKQAQSPVGKPLEAPTATPGATPISMEPGSFYAAASGKKTPDPLDAFLSAPTRAPGTLPGSAPSGIGASSVLDVAAPAALLFGMGIADAAMKPYVAGFESSIEARANSDPFQSQDFINQRADLIDQTARLKAERESGFNQFLSGFKGRSWNPADNEEVWLQQMANKQRLSRGELQQFDTIERETASRVESFLRPFARQGNVPNEAQVDQMIEFYKRQAENEFKLHKLVEERSSHMMMRPGSVGQSGKR